MVKFSKGMWETFPGIEQNWAVEIVESHVDTDSFQCLASTKRINHRGDTLNTPTITFDAQSPAEDIILLTATHWKSDQKTNNGPHYELFPDVDLKQLAASRTDNLITTIGDNELKLSTDTLSVSFNTKPHVFNVDIKSHGVQNPANPSKNPDQLLTQLGWRSVGYMRQNSTQGHPTSAMENPDEGKIWMTFQFQLAVGEKIYGLGERFGPFMKNGQTIEMWNEDGGTSSELTYKNIPFYISSRGYGIFIPMPGFISYEVQTERTTRINIAIPYERLSAYIIQGGTPKEILERYTLLTGRPALPPAWTFGLWLTTSFTTNYGEDTVNNFLDGMTERDIPVSVFHYDCFWMRGFNWCDFEFDPVAFPDAAGQLKRLHDRGTKVCVWINPYIAQASKIYDEGADNGYFIKKTDGTVWQWDRWQGGMAFIDFTNPAACAWYSSKLKTLVELGTDFGERIPTGNTVYYDGSNPDKMHNYYSFMYNKVTFEVLEKTLGKHNAVLFARSATAGGQRFPVHWGGDPMSTFEAMAESLRGGLSLGLCGFGYWAHDIGGFEGTPDAALYKRWFAFGALSSHSRLHGSGSFRVPWLIDETGEADIVLKTFIHLKHSLMPYIFSTAIETHQTGIPMMRALFVEYPEDPIGWLVDTQYMLGPSLMVAPVFNAEGLVQYYIPEGTWYGLIDHKLRTGPGYVTETHDFMSLPLLLRPGHAIATASLTERNVTYDWSKYITIIVNSVDKPVDMLLNIPNHEKPGEFKATVKVLPESVEVISGMLSGEFTVKVIQRDGSLKEFVSALGSASISF